MHCWAIAPNFVLHLRPDHERAILTHAERTYPEECCGLLLGTPMSGTHGWPERMVTQVWETENAWSTVATDWMADIVPPSTQDDPSRRDRYWIDPNVLLNVQRYARNHQFDIIGIYHSHPDHPAVPSECDRVLAWSSYSYVIVSVQQGTARDLRSWRLDENHQFKPEELVREGEGFYQGHCTL